MRIEQFCKKYNNTVKNGYSKTKILNRARKWGLRDTPTNIFEYLGLYLTLKECKGFL